MQVVSAVSEAFNNIVMHGYKGRTDGVVEIEIRTRRDCITIDMRDSGSSFDPTMIPDPDFASLPESGLGLFIIRAFMDITYTPGRPNVLTLTKTLPPVPNEETQEGDHGLVEGTPR